MFTLVFPDECRVCAAPLVKVSRVPVCPTCLSAPEPFAAEYYCLSCHAPFLTPHPLDDNGQCGLCRRGLSGFDAAYSYGSYDGILRKLIQLFKYGKIMTLAQPLGQLLAHAVPRERVYDVIVPMPMHWRRRWSRGFNQSALLAEMLAKRLSIRLSPAVRRKKSTPPQAGMTATQRRAMISGAFEVTRPADVSGKRVLLVDDVFTTGATAAACARALKRAGASHVAVMTVARADRRMQTIALPAQSSIATPPLGSLLDAQSGSTA